MAQEIDLAILGGGAAGFFSAISAAEKFPNKKVILFEKSQHLLSKVKISGGGRCNVTHNCLDNNLLVKNGFIYRSDINKDFLNVADLKKIIKKHNKF